MSSTGTTPKGAIPSAETLQCSKPRIQFKIKNYNLKGSKVVLPAKNARKNMNRPMMMLVLPEKMEEW